MSYDIYFVRRDPGESFEDALDNTEESFPSGGPGPLTSVELEQWERILPHAQAIFGHVEEFATESSRELTHPDTGVQLSIFPGEISITVPFGTTDDEVVVMEKVYALARAVEAETGLEGYDPQLGEPISTPSEDRARAAPRRVSEPPQDDRGVSASTVAADTPGPAEPSSSGAAAPSSAPRRRWWEFWKP